MEVGNKIKANSASWTFSGEVANVFDNHVEKSIPLYHEGHDLVRSMSDFFIKDNSVCYELGSSTGTLSNILATQHRNKKAMFYGLEKENGMIKKSKEKYSLPNLEFIHTNIFDYDYLPTDLIVSYYTIQFIHPCKRQELVNHLYNALNTGGALILFEKVRAYNAHFQDIFTMLYNEFKICNGFNYEEIIGKTLSLKGVLEPFTTEENYALLQKAGFKKIITVIKYLSFEGIIAIKD